MGARAIKKPKRLLLTEEEIKALRGAAAKGRL